MATPLVASAIPGGLAEATETSVSTGPIPARAYAATSPSGPLETLKIERRAVLPYDVLLDVLYCGICHSDIHAARNEWAS
jgi:hypothetical protein